MAEQNKTQMGDGADNYGQAAGQMAKAAKQLGQKAAKQAAAKGVEATANVFLNWLWLTVLYLMFCSLFYLAVLVINRVGKMVSLFIGVGLSCVILLVTSLFRFVFSQEFVSTAAEFVMKAMGFMSNGTTNLFFPILSFLVIGVVFGIGSYAVIRRTELK